MQVVQDKAEAGKAKLTVTIDASDWSRILDKAAADLSGQVRIPGFRPGAAPRDVVIAQVGEGKLISAAIELAVQEFYPKAIREGGVKPIAFPAISVEKVSLEEPLVFAAEVSVLPKVDLGDYKSIKLKKDIEPVKDEEIEAVLSDMRKRAAEHVEVERAAAMGDRVEIDFEGFLEGIPFPGGASKNHPIVLGDNMFIPGFEEGVVGMSKGEEKEISVSFPTDYHAKDLAGKPANFKVKLNKVTAVNYPDLDDAFATKYANLPTFAALREDVKNYLTHEAERRATEKVKEAAILELTKKMKVDLPEELVTQELDAMIHDLEHRVEDAKMTMEEYLAKAGTDKEGLRKEWHEQAEQRVRAGLALEAFREAENITVADEEISAEIESLKLQYPNDVAEIEKQYGMPTNREKLANLIASRKAIDKLVEITLAA